jgi:hypothetical protein
MDAISSGKRYGIEMATFYPETIDFKPTEYISL